LPLGEGRGPFLGGAPFLGLLASLSVGFSATPE